MVVHTTKSLLSLDIINNQYRISKIQEKLLSILNTLFHTQLSSESIRQKFFQECNYVSDELFTL